jgi:hypothetical protein
MIPDLAMAGSPPVPLPDWQVLEYEQQAFWVTARSRIELTAVVETEAEDAAGGGEQQWRLRAASSVASNREEVTVRLAASNGRALQRSRLSEGRDKRYKSYDFLPGYLLRERRNPPADASLPPAQWPVSSSKKIPYPENVGKAAITDAYALLELAGRFLASSEPTAEVVVSTDINFYRVQMSRGDDATIEVNYQLDGAQDAVSGARDTRAVKLQVKPVGTEQGKPDFSLLGLLEDITILFDPTTGVPLKLRGTAPRIGSTEIDLKTVTLRNPPQ